MFIYVYTYIYKCMYVYICMIGMGSPSRGKIRRSVNFASCIGAFGLVYDVIATLMTS